MMVEILCAALVGGKFSSEVDWSKHRGAQTPHTGQTIIVIDPGLGRGGLAPFADRVQHLIDTLHEAGASHIPGDRRHAARQAAEAGGIWISAQMHSSLEHLAAGT
jgi:delta1-piperideine-2-carboxylate reductase